ncbi:methylenetetrahydrofolate reductase (NAD(P)H) met13 [Polyrhizophydium stewartii]|uniref:Methylenetetrahydrofolate reductase (NAD(P)H) met13 n=1 Tax=Polyrhizophydium stewartii TaxID=2732419 RepID=A0ABR4N0B5_9FUNG
MKVSDKIRKAESERRCFWTDVGVVNLFDRMERMYMLGPEFIDVTWGAGGTTSDLTLEICTTAQSVYGLETCMHLTCTNMPREKIDIALEQAKKAGIQNILALRGDPPRGQENWTKVDTGFAYAVDLVRYIREKYGDYFCIGVAGYPEGHIENPDKEADLLHFKAKVDAGADYVVTQLFYDVDVYLDWVKRVRAMGITIPILPGILPIQNYSGFKRMTALSKTIVPQFILDDLEPIKDDDQAVKDYGVRLAIQMCTQMKEAGQMGFHFYCLNLERSTRLTLEGLGFVAPREQVRPLPWNPSLGKNREKETVRPIFWRNRTKSYIMRTEAWDEFPNGRWGDSRSPAFGDIDGYGVRLKYPAQECLQMWDHPETLAQIAALFVKYCSGELPSLPWSDSPLQGESDVLSKRLITVNANGFLTINSQPSVDGALSSDPVYGWGPKNGFVYQKAYLEFFISPAQLDLLVDRIRQHPFLTYYAVNKDGDLRTNTKGDSPNAVTWGVFPGQEIVQPTVVEGSSFLAWKDEAFELWNQWSLLHGSDSPTHKLLQGIRDSWFLINVVDNNYKSRFAIYDILDEIAAQTATSVAH